MSNEKETALAPENIIQKVFETLRLEESDSPRTAMIGKGLSPLPESHPVTPEDRMLSALSALLLNVTPCNGRFEKAEVFATIATIDKLVNDQVNEILHSPSFQKMESSWRGLYDLAANVNFSADIGIDILDVSKEELYEDFDNNSSDIFGCALFDKVYVAEYDQYGGRPFGVVIGDYEFSHTPQDLFFLRMMGKVAAASHAPFVGSVSAAFFGCKTVEEFDAIRNLEGLINHPKYGPWNAFRETDESAYIGLTFPRFILRKPWHPETQPVPDMNFTEMADGTSGRYLWGNAVWLFARNLAASFADTGWCQYIRGPKGGGLISGLPVDTFNIRGQDEMMAPVELTIPDYRELALAQSGFIPLVYRKSSSDATFFSVQSVKKPRKLKDPKDAENSRLVTNLAYTFSITRIAHYIKSIMRDNIGTAADAAYIQKLLTSWISQFVTTAQNPDDLTLQAFPFKAAVVEVLPKPGQIGWCKCVVSVLPHVQFEGMDVELRLESRLGD